jgi:2-polyprenyl-6-methoxyphenol hydroxylase-like FAD-dependent oxidoreductase
VSNAQEIIVVGAGIGGLTTALALGNSGHAVRVLEQAPEIAPIGYGIQLGPNTLPILEQLGVGDEVLCKSIIPEALVMREANGEHLARVELRNEGFSSRFAGRYMAIHRGDLHDILKAALSDLPNVTMEVDTRVTGYVEHDEQVVLETADGRSLQGAAVIAADGLRSVFRDQLHPGDQPRPIGYAAHRSILPMAEMADDISRDEVVLWLGPGWHIIHYPLRDRTELNVVAVFKDALCSDSTNSEQRRQFLLTHLSDSHRALKAVVERMDLERNWPIADRQPLRGWSSSRMTLLGDSAHATLQSLAQGAGMAIEDAVALASCLEGAGDDFESAFQKFERERFVRTARVTLESRRLWVMYHEESEVGQAVRRQEYQQRNSEDLQACLEWVWSAPVADLQLLADVSSRSTVHS